MLVSIGNGFVNRDAVAWISPWASEDVRSTIYLIGGGEINIPETAEMLARKLGWAACEKCGDTGKVETRARVGGGPPQRVEKPCPGCAVDPTPPPA